MEYLVAGLGGVGLFLLGMWLITDGLKLAAGPSLEHLLSHWTSNRLRGLGAGIFLTALVQSSSVITLAVIGFVSSGLMTFKRAVWVIFGSNLGTTLTVWLVALIGFRFRIDVFALPIIGVGALLRIAAPSPRWRSLGMALAGFGILFLGIDTLADGFSSLSEQVTLDSERYSTFAMVLIGIVLTAVMMSSAAVITLTLSALVAGLLPFSDAIAVVIGANIGTTSTAVLAMIGATSQARRLALMHVLFNVITAAVILLLLQPVLQLVLLIGELTGQTDEPATLLALFHFLFSLIGIILMWPLEPLLSNTLQKLFRRQEQQPETLNFLDPSLLTVPDAIPAALYRELADMLAEYPLALSQLLQAPLEQQQRGSAQRRQKLDSMGDFFIEASRSAVTSEVAGYLVGGWHSQHNLMNCEEALSQISEALRSLQTAPDHAKASLLLDQWFNNLGSHLAKVHNSTEGALDFMALFPAYDELKQLLLQAAMAGQMTRPVLDAALHAASLSRRLAEQWLRAITHWQGLPSAETALKADPQE